MFSGFLFDQTGSFDASFYVAGGVGMMGGLLTTVVYVRTRNTQKNLPTETVRDEENHNQLLDKVSKSQVLYASSEFGSQIIHPKV